MSRASRDKGRKGEADVAALYRAAGFTVRGLEGSGDHLAIGHGLVIHSESKRCETARPWAWLAQAEPETPPGALTVVTFRRSRSPWYSLAPTVELLAAIASRRPT